MMTRLNEVERVALEELFLGLPSDTVLVRIFSHIKRVLNLH